MFIIQGVNIQPAYRPPIVLNIMVNGRMINNRKIHDDDDDNDNDDFMNHE